MNFLYYIYNTKKYLVWLNTVSNCNVLSELNVGNDAMTEEAIASNTEMLVLIFAQTPQILGNFAVII
jgi:hypothetical protein